MNPQRLSPARSARVLQSGNSHIREGASIGRNCVVGRGAYVGPGGIGRGSKIQNYALFLIGTLNGLLSACAVPTNDQYPRAVNVDCWRSQRGLGARGGLCRRGSIDRSASCLRCPPRSVDGRWSRHCRLGVPDFALVAGPSARRML